MKREVRRKQRGYGKKELVILSDKIGRQEKRKESRRKKMVVGEKCWVGGETNGR